MERDTTVDAARGFAILLVVLGHAVQYNITDPTNNIIFKIIYSFHMPLFMFISGYLAWNHINNKNLDYIVKKFKNLVIPFISWYLVGYIILLIVYGTTTGFVDYILQWIIHPDYGLWFLWILFLNFVVLFIALKFEKLIGDFSIVAVIVVLYSLYFFKFNNYTIGMMQYYFPIFALAYLVAKNKETILKWKFPIIIIAAISFPILIQFWQFDLSISNIINHYATAISGIVLAICFIVAIKNQIITWIGKYTLDIYVSSQIFLGALISMFATFPDINIVIKIVLCAVLSLVLSLMLSFFVIRKSKILIFIFLGQV